MSSLQLEALTDCLIFFASMAALGMATGVLGTIFLLMLEIHVKLKNRGE